LAKLQADHAAVQAELEAMRRSQATQNAEAEAAKRKLEEAAKQNALTPASAKGAAKDRLPPLPLSALSDQGAIKFAEERAEKTEDAAALCMRAERSELRKTQPGGLYSGAGKWSQSETYHASVSDDPSKNIAQRLERMDEARLTELEKAQQLVEEHNRLAIPRLQDDLFLLNRNRDEIKQIMAKEAPSVPSTARTNQSSKFDSVWDEERQEHRIRELQATRSVSPRRHYIHMVESDADKLPQFFQASNHILTPREIREDWRGRISHQGAPAHTRLQALEEEAAMMKSRSIGKGSDPQRSQEYHHMQQLQEYENSQRREFNEGLWQREEVALRREAMMSTTPRETISELRHALLATELSIIKSQDEIEAIHAHYSCTGRTL